MEQPALGHRITQIERVGEVRVNLGQLLTIEKNKGGLDKSNFSRRDIG